jgi:hypothetical protein
MLNIFKCFERIKLGRLTWAKIFHFIFMMLICYPALEAVQLLAFVFILNDTMRE